MSHASLLDLPSSAGYFHVYITGMQIDLDHVGDFLAEADTTTGWVDYDWSPSMLHENKSDVPPYGLTSTSEIDARDPDFDTFTKVILDCWRDVLLRVGPVTATNHGYDVDDAYVEKSLSTTLTLHAQLSERRCGGKTWQLTDLPNEARKCTTLIEHPSSAMGVSA